MFGQTNCKRPNEMKITTNTDKLIKNRENILNVGKK